MISMIWLFCATKLMAEDLEILFRFSELVEYSD